MTIALTPSHQPSQPEKVTVQEFWLDPKAPFQVVGIPDGWRPLGIRSLEHSLILAALVNTSRPPCAEVFRLALPGDDLGDLQEREGVDLYHLGQTYDGRHLFLDVKPEAEEAVQVRRIGRLDIGR